MLSCYNICEGKLPLLEKAFGFSRFQVFDLCWVPLAPSYAATFPLLFSLFGSGLSGLGCPLAEVSIEMVFRGLGYFAQALLKGETAKLIPFLLAHAKDLGLVKRRRKKPALQVLTDAACA